MVKHNFLVVFLSLVLVSESSFCQQENLSDSSHILSLVKKSTEIADKQPDSSLQLIRTALNSSLRLGYVKGTALSYAGLGRWYFGNNTDSSIHFAQKALAIFGENNTYAANRVNMHLLLAEVYDEQGHTDSSAYYYYLLGNEAEAENIPDASLMVNIYTKLAIFWVNMTNGFNNDRQGQATVKSYVDKVKLYSQRMSDPANALASTYFIQGIYYHYSNFDSARFFYNEYLKKLKTINLPRKISTLANIADTYLMETQPENAMVYINQVKLLAGRPDSSNYLGFYMAFIGLMEGKALYQQKKYTDAITVLERSLQKLKSTGGHLRQDVVEAYKNLAASYEATGNYPKALANSHTYTLLYDSLTRKEKTDMVIRQEIRYRIAQKDKELVEQQLTIARVKEKVKNRNLVIAGIGLFVLIITLLLIMWRRRNIHKQKLQQQNIENLQQKIKIERLNATIAGEEKERTRIARELHDGVGGLITAAKMNFELVKNSTAKENNTDFLQGIQLLEEAGSELRQAAQNLMPEILLQEGLVKAVEVFCQRVSEKSDTQISFQAMGEKNFTDAGFELSIYRIIQELVHNIVKHSRASNAIVQINFNDDGGMNITVEDDGVGINKTTVTRVSGGMGLKNIEDRIKETGGKLDIKSSEGEGTSVYIEYESQQ